MEEQIDPIKCANYIIKNGEAYAQAKAERIYLEEYRKSLKALLQKKSASEALNAQERDAYAHPDYIAHIQALKVAIEKEEAIRWMLVAAQAKIEIFRSIEATNRNQDRSLR